MAALGSTGVIGRAGHRGSSALRTEKRAVIAPRAVAHHCLPGVLCTSSQLETPCFQRAVRLSSGLSRGWRISSTSDDKENTTATTTEAAAPGLEPQQAEPVMGEQSVAGQLLSLMLLISPFFFWGTSMVSMKELSLHTTPLAVSAWRLLPAGALVVAWANSTGRKAPSGTMAWVAIALFGIVDGACFQGFLAEGLQRTSAGLGSVIIDSQPLSVAVLAALLFGESLTGVGVLGLAVGVGGLCLLEVPPEVITSLLNGEGLPSGAGKVVARGSIWDSGEFWMLLAAQSMAVGTVMVRWVSKYVDPVMATGWHMILGSVPLIVLSAAQESSDLLPRLAQLDGLDLFNLFYVTVLGSAASYGVFFYNAAKGNLTALSSLTFLTPMFAAGTGYLFLGERLTPLQLAGAGITLGAVYLINTKGSSGGGDENK